MGVMSGLELLPALAADAFEGTCWRAIGLIVTGELV